MTHHDLSEQPVDAEDRYDPDSPHYDEEAAFGRWWAQLPDFIKFDYTLDIPPARMPFAQAVFTEVGAPRLCPKVACRRGGACKGGDGPACYRADRAFLGHVLFLWWMMIFAELSWEDYQTSLRAKGSPYAQPADATKAKARPAKARRR